MTDAFLQWLQEAGKHWDNVKPEDVMRELGREPMETVGADMVAFMRDGPRRIQELEARCAALKELVNQQAKDDGLWFRAQTAPEAYLQHELRKLHAFIEATDAGKAMLERLQKAERIVDFDRHVALDANRREALEEMRERCAKVAEEWWRERGRSGGNDISSRIRALPLEDNA